MRDAWVNKTAWNGTLGVELSNKFKKWMEETTFFKKIWIPRNAFGGEEETFQIHTFTDASKSAYAAAVFLRVVVKGKIRIYLPSKIQSFSNYSGVNPSFGTTGMFNWSQTN